METILFIAILIALFIIRTPLYIIVAAISIYLFTVADESLAIIIIELTRLSKESLLIAIPLFTFAGYLLSESNTPTRLVNLSKALFGFLPGGLAIVTLITCALFTAFTGASGVTIIALGGLLYPILMKQGYKENFSLGLMTTSGSLGLLFPPSLPLILYGIVSRADIKNLFTAGIIPGVLLILILVIYSVYQGKDLQVRHESEQPFELSKIKSKIDLKDIYQLLLTISGIVLSYYLPDTVDSAVSFFIIIICCFFLLKVLVKWLFNDTVRMYFDEAKWEVLLPILIVSGIYSGQFTAIESAAVTAVYVLVVEVFIHKEISLRKDFLRICGESMTLVGAILIIMAVALAFTNYLIDESIPEIILDWIKQYIDNKYLFLIALNIFLLIVGSIMDIFSAILVIVPLITPLGKEYGIDPVHLGIIFLTNLEIGYMTPPVGLNLFISSFRFEKSIFTLYRATLPYILLLLLALMLITYVPELSLFLIGD